MPQLGKILVIIGLTIAFCGLLLWLFGNKFNWLGSLPGDIKIERPGFKFYFPITTMILISAIISAALWVWRKYF